MKGKMEKGRAERSMKELVSAPWLSPAEAARLLGLSTMSIYRLLWSHQLSCVRISNILRISRSALDSYLSLHHVPANPSAAEAARPGAGREGAEAPAVAVEAQVPEAAPAHEVRE